MLEILALIFITKEIGKLAAQKGLPAGKWKLISVLLWIVMEFIGIAVGLIIFGRDNLFSIVIIGIAFAITSYFLVKGHLQKLPDAVDGIDNIGQ